MSKWTVKDMPSLAGRRAAVTGATGGLGYETALALAQAGAEVMVLGRNPREGAQCREEDRQRSAVGEGAL